MQTKRSDNFLPMMLMGVIALGFLIGLVFLFFVIKYS